MLPALVGGARACVPFRRREAEFGPGSSPEINTCLTVCLPFPPRCREANLPSPPTGYILLLSPSPFQPAVATLELTHKNLGQQERAMDPHAQHDLDVGLGRMSLASKPSASTSAPSRVSKQYLHGSAATSGASSSMASTQQQQQQQRSFLPSSAGAGAGAGSRAGGGMSYFGGGGPGGSSSTTKTTTGTGQDRGPLSRLGAVANMQSVSGSASGTGKLDRKMSTDRLNAQVSAGSAGSTQASSRGAAGGVPTVDVGRYDGGLERDERKGRRTMDASDSLNLDSALAG